MRRPATMLSVLGKRKRIMSGLPAQAMYTKHVKLMATSSNAAVPETAPLEPPKKLVRYYQGTETVAPSCTSMCPSLSSA